MTESYMSYLGTAKRNLKTSALSKLELFSKQTDVLSKSGRLSLLVDHHQVSFLASKF